MDKHYDDFIHIEHKNLRTYNRCMTATVINESHGEEECLRYVSQFSGHEKREMYAMLCLIDKEGRDSVKREIMKELQ